MAIYLLRIFFLSVLLLPHVLTISANNVHVCTANVRYIEQIPKKTTPTLSPHAVKNKRFSRSNTAQQQTTSLPQRTTKKKKRIRVITYKKRFANKKSIQHTHNAAQQHIALVTRAPAKTTSQSIDLSHKEYETTIARIIEEQNVKEKAVRSNTVAPTPITSKNTYTIPERTARNTPVPIDPRYTNNTKHTAQYPTQPPATQEYTVPENTTPTTATQNSAYTVPERTAQNTTVRIEPRYTNNTKRTTLYSAQPPAIQEYTVPENTTPTIPTQNSSYTIPEHTTQNTTVPIDPRYTNNTKHTAQYPTQPPATQEYTVPENTTPTTATQNSSYTVPERTAQNTTVPIDPRYTNNTKRTAQYPTQPAAAQEYTVPENTTPTTATQNSSYTVPEHTMQNTPVRIDPRYTNNTKRTAQYPTQPAAQEYTVPERSTAAVTSQQEISTIPKNVLQHIENSIRRPPNKAPVVTRLPDGTEIIEETIDETAQEPSLNLTITDDLDKTYIQDLPLEQENAKIYKESNTGIFSQKLDSIIDTIGTTGEEAHNDRTTQSPSPPKEKELSNDEYIDAINTLLFRNNYERLYPTSEEEIRYSSPYTTLNLPSSYSLVFAFNAALGVSTNELIKKYTGQFSVTKARNSAAILRSIILFITQSLEYCEEKRMLNNSTRSLVQTFWLQNRDLIQNIHAVLTQTQDLTLQEQNSLQNFIDTFIRNTFTNTNVCIQQEALLKEKTYILENVEELQPFVDIVQKFITQYKKPL